MRETASPNSGAPMNADESSAREFRFVALAHREQPFARLHRVEQLAIEDHVVFLIALLGLLQALSPRRQRRSGHRGRAQLAMHFGKHLPALARSSWQRFNSA